MKKGIKGIIYVMSTSIRGVIKIGTTRIDRFKRRMRELKENGYRNVNGLKFEFAIKVDGYKEKEELLKNILSKNIVNDAELYCLKLSAIVELLSCFNGEEINENGEEKCSSTELFREVKKVKVNKREKNQSNFELPPDGIYYFKIKKKTLNTFVEGILSLKNGKLILKSGSTLAPMNLANNYLSEQIKNKRKEFGDTDKIVELKYDFYCNSLYEAGVLVSGKNINAWKSWKDSEGNFIDKYRKK